MSSSKSNQVFQHIAGFFPNSFSTKELGDPIILNPFNSPRFRLRASEETQQDAFAFGVPHDINGFHPYTVSSSCLFLPLVLPYPMHFSG